MPKQMRRRQHEASLFVLDISNLHQRADVRRLKT